MAANSYHRGVTMDKAFQPSLDDRWAEIKLQSQNQLELFVSILRSGDEQRMTEWELDHKANRWSFPLVAVETGDFRTSSLFWMAATECGLPALAFLMNLEYYHQTDVLSWLDIGRGAVTPERLKLVLSYWRARENMCHSITMQRVFEKWARNKQCALMETFFGSVITFPLC
jgi:hypothetical protein